MDRRKLAAFSFFSVMAFALSITITPPSLLSIIDTFKINFSRVGLLFGISFFGYFVGVSFGGFISDLMGRKVIVLGIFLLALSLLLFGFSPWYWVLLVTVWFVGSSGGLIEGTASALAGDLYPKRKGYSLNLSQVFFGIGALVGPLIPGCVLSLGLNWRLSYIIVSLITFLLLGLFLKHGFPPSPHTQKLHLGETLQLFKSKIFLFFSICMMLYAGAEIGFASWIPVYMQENLSSSTMIASIALSLFWGSMIGGRLLMSWLSDKIFYPYLILFGAVFGMLSMVTAILFTNVMGVLILVAMTGFFLSGIWPTILACAGNTFPEHLGTAFGIIISFGAIGAALCPWIVGLLIELIGMKYGLCSLTILLLGIIGIFLYAKVKRGYFFGPAMK